MSFPLVRNIDGHPNYMVTSDGRVFSKSRAVRAKLGTTRWVTGRWLAISYTAKVNGYAKVLLGHRLDARVHRLVADAFIPNPNKLPQVNHKNGKKGDNRVENLEWCTQTENIRHGFATGLITPNGRGENSRSSKLTQKQVDQIKKLISQGVSQRKIGKKFGVSATTISRIKMGDIWVDFQ